MVIKLMHYLDIIVKVLSSKILTVFILLAWIVTIIFSWWFIPPKIDDAIYLVPAISVFNNYFPGAFIANSIEPIFFIFPTQPFVHGLFLKFLNFFSISVDIYSYRVFNYSLVVLLFYSVYKLFSTLYPKGVCRILSINVFLSTLGLSQFSYHFYVNRPEVLGLLFFVIGFTYSIKFITNTEDRKYFLVLAFLFFGLSTTLHPFFFILVSTTIIYLLYIAIELYKARCLYCLISFFMPILALLVWFLVNLGEVQRQFINRVSEVSTVNFSGVRNIFSIITGDSSQTFLHNLYLSLHMLPLLASLLLLLVFLLWNNKDNIVNTNIVTLFKLLSISVFLLLFSIGPLSPYYLLISFLSIILLIFFLLNNNFLIEKFKTIRKKNVSKNGKFFKILVYIFLSFLPLSLPAFHSMKVYTTNNTFFNHHETLYHLESNLSDDTHIFITQARLLPLFSDRINEDFSNFSKVQNKQIHWYFPIGVPAKEETIELMTQTLNNDMNLMQGAVWGSSKELSLIDEKNQSACLLLIGGKHFIRMDDYKILYEDRDNIFLTSDKVITSNNCSFIE